MRIQKQQCTSVVQYGSAVLVFISLLGLAAHAVSGASQVVRAGDDLQAAIDGAQPGDEIRLQAGAVFTGNFVLRARAGGNDAPITIRTDTADNRLPSAGQRIGPQHASLLPTLTPAINAPVIRTEPGAGHWRLIGLRILGKGTGDLIALGDVGSAQAAYAQVPEDIVLDRLLVLGDSEQGQKRGIALNSAATTIRNSYIADIKEVGQETQAIAGWNGPGPYLIENNYLEAAGISVLFGGAEPSIGGLVPSDITVRRNVMAKPTEWRNESWTVKNLLELKNARRVHVEGNLFERNWSAAQVGFAILFTVRASGPRASWSTIEDVTFENNLVRHVAGGINILGHDTAAPSQQARNLVIRNNLFYDLDEDTWGGSGMFLQVGDEPADILVEHNTIVQSGNLVTASGGTRRRRVRSATSGSVTTSRGTTPMACSATASAWACRRSPPTFRTRVYGERPGGWLGRSLPGRQPLLLGERGDGPVCRPCGRQLPPAPGELGAPGIERRRCGRCRPGRNLPRHGRRWPAVISSRRRDGCP